MITFITVCSVILIAVVFALIGPSFRRDSSRLSILDEWNKLQQERERLMLNLQDLESDLRLEKVSARDYEFLKSETVQLLSKVYEAMDRLEESDPLFRRLKKDLAS